MELLDLKVNINLLQSSYFKNISFWDIYFRLIKNFEDSFGNYWADIEKQLDSFLRYDKNNIKQNKIFNLMNRYFLYNYIENKDSINKSFFRDLAIFDNDRDIANRIIQKLSMYIYKKVLVDSNGKYEEEVEKLQEINSNNLSLLIDKNKKFLYTFLYDELKVFENNLKDYIKKQVDENKQQYYKWYEKVLTKIAEPSTKIEKQFREHKQKKIRKLINKNRALRRRTFAALPQKEVEIIQDEIETIQEEIDSFEENKYNLISFNYTKASLPPNCSNLINIHGNLDLDNDIIIGIDEKNINENDYDLYRFTKTYRLFELNNDSNTCLDKSIKFIKFYGHSLADADYSYFQSIFDFYDIYNSDVSLIFYYSNFDKKTDQRHITINSVVKLIKTYGNTLDNKDHGKNLLHKLELENRLLIKEL